MTIGSDSNFSLADKLCEFKGYNYFSIAKTEELENYLVTNFKNIFFPIVHNAKLHVVCKNNNVKIVKCIGYSGSEISINTNNESIFNKGTCFPSEIITLTKDDKDKNYVEGGIFLLKLQSLSNEKMNFEFNFEYETIDGKKSSQNYEYKIIQEQLNLDYFSSKNIQKGISIFYFTEVLNAFVEKFNQLDNYDDGGEMKKNKEIEFIELRTEHQRQTDLQHVAGLAQVVKPVIIGRSGIVQIQTGCLESVSRSGVQESEIQTGLEQELAVFQAVSHIQTGSGTALELLIRIALIDRSGSHVRSVDFVHHSGITQTQT